MLYQHSQYPEKYKKQKLKNKMADSTVQCFKVREIELISKNVWRKIKEKVIERRCRLIHYVKIILILLLKNLSHQKNIGSYIVVVFLSMMDEVYHQPFLNKLSNKLKLFDHGQKFVTFREWQKRHFQKNLNISSTNDVSRSK